MLRPLLLALVLSTCGIKGPPRPPVDAVAPASPIVPAPDAGCCAEAK